MDPIATNDAIQTSTGFLPMFIMMSASLFISVVIWLLATYLGPNRPSKAKNRPYECGIIPTENVHHRLDVHFYRVGILFLIFGVEVLFFFPWAAAMAKSTDRAFRLLALADMYVFMLILIVAFIYAWAKGGLRWSQHYKQFARIPEKEKV